jgi:hypothetical protein
MERIPGALRMGGVLAGLLALGWLLSGNLGAAQAGSPPPREPAAAGAPNTWSIQATYPISVSWQALAAQGGQLYSFGGEIDNVDVDNAYKYDPAANSWRAIRFLPHPLYSASAVSDGTAVYIVNGAGHNSLYRYDPQADTYTELAAPTVATHSQAVVYLGGKIYRIGGFIGTTTTDSVEVYTIATNTWATAAPYLPLREMMAVAANGYIYAA